MENLKWSKVSRKDIDKVKREKYVNCPYAGVLQNENSLKKFRKNPKNPNINYVDYLYCNFNCIANRSRETDIFECNHYKDDPKIVRQLRAYSNKLF